VLGAAGFPVGVLIFFESAFPAQALAQRRAGAALLVNATNDAWFRADWRGSAARAQHEAHAVVRALEGRVPVLRSANGGPSLLVEASGEVTPVAAAGVEGVRILRVEPAEPAPPAAWVAPVLGPALALAAALVLMAGLLRLTGVSRREIATPAEAGAEALPE
jgi:apolipoprotein N-acyltransferase